MIYKINVWERSLENPRLVGEMICDLTGGRAKSAFRYDSSYLNSKCHICIDPVSLPLNTETFVVSSSLFGAFEDSLPDDWGKRLLVRRHNIPRHDQNLPSLLLALGSSGLGALLFTDSDKPHATSTETSIIHLSTLVTAAEQFERGDPQEPGLALLFGAGSSPGGARPKVVVFDEETGGHYVAKFPSVKDQEDVVGIESATMNMARLAGLNVPDTCLVRCERKPVLLVRRFDVTPQNSRNHMISFQTLLKAQGYYQHRYQDLLAVLRKYSNDPQEDSERFFRQMVFNAVVGNTDDHLKNFWMIYSHLQGWRLSPAFDLIPNVGRNDEHVLFFDTGAYFPGRKRLEKLGRQWGIHNADLVVAQVFEAVAAWREIFAIGGVSAVDIDKFKEIDANLLS